MTEEERKQKLTDIVKIAQSGYGGMTPDGKTVDRRMYPSAIPIPENSLMKIPKPIDFEFGECDACGRVRQLFKSKAAKLCYEHI